MSMSLGLYYELQQIKKFFLNKSRPSQYSLIHLLIHLFILSVHSVSGPVRSWEILLKGLTV